MRNAPLHRFPRRATALLWLCCACLLASAATRAAPCHGIAMSDPAGAIATAGMAVRGATASTDATSASMQRGHDVFRSHHAAGQHDARQDGASAIPVTRTAMPHADSAMPAGDCCGDGSCAMDCGCAAMAPGTAPAPGAAPARSALLAINPIRRSSVAPGELLRPPIPA